MNSYQNHVDEKTFKEEIDTENENFGHILILIQHAQHATLCTLTSMFDAAEWPTISIPDYVMPHWLWAT